MDERRKQARRRRWADILVIAIGVYEFGVALWGAGLAEPRAITTDVANLEWYWLATGGGGTLAITAVIVALFHRTLARALLAAAGLLVLSGALAYREVNALTIIHMVLPGLALLAATPFFGAMPSPEEEGHRR